MRDIVEELKMLAAAAIDPRVKMTATSAIDEIIRLQTRLHGALDDKTRLVKMVDRLRADVDLSNKQFVELTNTLKIRHDEIERLRAEREWQPLPEPPVDK